MCAELASEATGVALMQFSGILGDIYGMEPVLRSLALVLAHIYTSHESIELHGHGPRDADGSKAGPLAVRAG